MCSVDSSKPCLDRFGIALPRFKRKQAHRAELWREKQTENQEQMLRKNKPEFSERLRWFSSPYLHIFCRMGRFAHWYSNGIQIRIDAESASKQSSPCCWLSSKQIFCLSVYIVGLYVQTNEQSVQTIKSESIARKRKRRNCVSMYPICKPHKRSRFNQSLSLLFNSINEYYFDEITGKQSSSFDFHENN